HDFRNSCQVWPFVVPAALAASHSEPNSFMMLSALAALEPAIAIPSAITAAAPTRRTDKQLCDLSQRRKGGSDLLLVQPVFLQRHHPSAEQVDSGAAIHRSLEGLQFVDLSFGLPVCQEPSWNEN